MKTKKRTEIKESKKLYQPARQKKINLTLDYGGGIEHFEGKTKQNKTKNKTKQNKNKKKKKKKNKKTSPTCET